MEKQKIGNIERFALSMMSTPGPLFDFSSKRDDQYFNLVKNKFIKYSGKTMLDVYINIAKEFISENPSNIDIWAVEKSFYSPYIFAVVNSYQVIENKADKKENIEIFKECGQKILKLEPFRLLQLNSQVGAYTSSNGEIYVVEDLLTKDKPILCLYLDNSEKYVKSYIPLA